MRRMNVNALMCQGTQFAAFRCRKAFFIVAVQLFQPQHETM